MTEMITTKIAQTRTYMVYRHVGKRTEYSNFGDKQFVTVYLPKRIIRTNEKRKFDDGYSTYMTDLYVDAQGRIYHHQPTFDMGVPYYKRDEDDAMFAGRPDRFSRDVFGRPVGKATPPLADGDDLTFKPNQAWAKTFKFERI